MSNPTFILRTSILALCIAFLVAVTIALLVRRLSTKETHPIQTVWLGDELMVVLLVREDADRDELQKAIEQYLRPFVVAETAK